MTTVDKDTLLTDHLDQDKVELPRGGVVVIRSLSRQEVLDYRDSEVQTTAEAERWLLSHAMVDPALTPGEAALWQKSSPPDEIETVMPRIMRLSGLVKDAGKDAYKSVRGESGS